MNMKVGGLIGPIQRIKNNTDKKIHKKRNDIIKEAFI